MADTEHPDDPTIGVMRAMRWRYEPQNDGFRRGPLWVARNQAQACVAAAINGNEYVPSRGQSAALNEITKDVAGPKH